MDQTSEFRNSTMESATWEQTMEALTHILTSPTTTPSLHSQFLISSRISSSSSPFLFHYYPPISNPNLLNWSISHFLNRVSKLGLPETSWRSKCPYYQPPPLVMAKGVEEGKWGTEEKKKYVRKRLRRGKLGSDVNPLIPLLIPNLLLFSLLLWNPFPQYND